VERLPIEARGADVGKERKLCAFRRAAARDLRPISASLRLGRYSRHRQRDPSVSNALLVALRPQLHQYHVVLILLIQRFGLQTDGLARVDFELGKSCRFLIQQAFDDVLVRQHHQLLEFELT
jgi:hypothetical protein